MISASASGNAEEMLKNLKKEVEQADKMNATISGADVIEYLSKIVGKNVLAIALEYAPSDTWKPFVEEVFKARTGATTRVRRGYEAWGKAMIKALYQAVQEGALGRVKDITRRIKRAAGSKSPDIFGVRDGGWDRHLKTIVGHKR